MSVEWSKWASIAAVIGAIPILYAVGSRLAPWEPAEAGQQIDGREKAHYQTTQQQIQQLTGQVQQLNSNVSTMNLNLTTSLLYTNRSIAATNMAHERPGSSAWYAWKKQVDCIDVQMAHPGMKPIC